jgi:hypothetical protein
VIAARVRTTAAAAHAKQKLQASEARERIAHPAGRCRQHEGLDARRLLGKERGDDRSH